ncbi:hypothetical protein C9374_004305 [Naegleria lovaniensis]|uniref:F-box domain-containing protein n=1 Tax=Naegleria lovaniensis TaxID=51637 RepID=A0AA88GR41_NAELO|nr:uncharacterized protein C9374_004305 [Naegleria lovaniensis]KAG2383634.1 hypothetical protein C9374_004305 [Naegleria lovaniensis]
MHSGGEIEWLFPPHTGDDSSTKEQQETELVKQEDANHCKKACMSKKAYWSKMLLRKKHERNVGSEINELLQSSNNEVSGAASSSSDSSYDNQQESLADDVILAVLDQQYSSTSSHLQGIKIEEIFMDDYVETSNTSLPCRSQTNTTSSSSSSTNGSKDSQPTCTKPKAEIILDDLNDRHRQMMHIVKGVDAVAHNFNLAPTTPDQRYLNHYIRDNDDCSSSSTNYSNGKARTLSDQESDFSSERGDFEREVFFQFSNDHLNNYVFLPDELCYKIFSYLDYEFVVLTISCVNRQFLSVSNSGGFWIPFIKSRKCSESINILSHYLYSAPSIRPLTQQSKTEDITTNITTETATDPTEQEITDNIPTISQTTDVVSSHALNHDPVNHLTIYRTLFLSFLYHKRNLKRWFFITEANYYLLFLAPLTLLTFLFLASYVFPVFPQFYKLNLFQDNVEKSIPNPSLLTDNPLTRRPTIYIEGIGETFSKFALGVFGLCVLLIICSFLLIKPLTTRVLKAYSLTNIPPEDCSMLTKSIISKIKQSDSEKTLIRSPTEVLPLSLRKKLFRNILGHEMLWTQEHYVRNMMLLPLLICILSVMLKNFIYIPVISESYHVVLSSPAYLIILVLIKKHWYMVFKTQGFFSILICYSCFHFLMNQLKWDMLIRPMFYFLGQVVGVWAYIILNFWVLGGPDSSGIPCAN